MIKSEIDDLKLVLSVIIFLLSMPLLFLLGILLRIITIPVWLSNKTSFDKTKPYKYFIKYDILK